MCVQEPSTNSALDRISKSYRGQRHALPPLVIAGAMGVNPVLFWSPALIKIQQPGNREEAARVVFYLEPASDLRV